MDLPSKPPPLVEPRRRAKVEAARGDLEIRYASGSTLLGFRAEAGRAERLAARASRPTAAREGRFVTFSNVYDDAARAAAYATLEFPGTYYLAYRDLPGIIAEHVTGREALDFGCGSGRSTRFLKRLGFSAIGIDISPSMIELARSADPSGTYVRVRSGDFHDLSARRFDVILSAFAFDNIPEVAKRRDLLRALRGLLARQGRLVLLGSTPEIYLHEWASFSTEAFPENRDARSGDPVRIVMKDVADSRPVIDVLWRHEDYLELYAAAGLELLAHHTPLGSDGEPYPWIHETSIAPWFIDVLTTS